MSTPHWETIGPPPLSLFVLETAARGDGHPVLVLPGLAGRRFLDGSAAALAARHLVRRARRVPRPRRWNSHLESAAARPRHFDPIKQVASWAHQHQRERRERFDLGEEEALAMAGSDIGISQAARHGRDRT
jgi:hypothetical protein